MMNTRRAIFGLLFGVFLGVSWSMAQEGNGTSNRLERYLLIGKQQPDLGRFNYHGTKLEKGRWAWETLRTWQKHHQAPLTLFLDSLGVPYEPYFLSNAVLIEVAPEVLPSLKSREDVLAVVDPGTFMQELPVKTATGGPRNELPWGLALLQVRELWDMGIQGQGVTVAGHDTGVDWEHPALVRQYRGWTDQGVDHNYNWFDAIEEISSLHMDSIVGPFNNPCGLSISIPCDDVSSSHGTHTVGTMVGFDSIADIHIGVAPRAQWIAVRNMERGYGSPMTYLRGFEWLLAPRDSNDQNPDPDKAPHIINNSWACPPKEGCFPEHYLLMETAIRNLRAAGIAVVVSAGNSGRAGCGTVQFPPAILENALVVGSIDANDSLSDFSSKGPVVVDSSFRKKPDLVAPGGGVLSSVKQGYGVLSGTSMAAPHVAGVMALMISANPALAGQIDELEKILLTTAQYKAPAEQCVDVNSRDWNASYGYGRIDAKSAVLAAIDYTSEREFGDHLQVRIYPNPALNRVYVDADATIQKIQVFDLFGRKLVEVFQPSEITEIYTANWPPAMYNCLIESKQGMISRKIIVAR